MRANLTTKQSDGLIDAEDAINAARDFIHLAILAGDRVGGETGSAYVRVLSCASDELSRSLISLHAFAGAT